ncbi:MAG TPA: HlyD family efflux transporter periplasmic adaptor subunit [Pirellulales bacterium]|nr:HlyD family efflux transporter periplasmic adaptor subunit [Pirellulales bacterium]
MKRLLRMLSYAALALAAAALLGYAFLPQPAEVEIARAERGPLEVTVNEDGKTRIKERYMVVAPLGGELLRVHLHAGDAVRAGETILAVIQPSDPTLLDARELAEAEARVKAAEARTQHAQALSDRATAAYNEANTRYARIEKLLPSGAASRDQYDVALNALRTATEDVRAGKFAVKIAEYELQLARAALTRTQAGAPMSGNRLEIHSPIDGEVLRESEGMVAAGTQLVQLGDRRDLELEIDVLSADAVRIPPGAQVHLEHWGSAKPLEARVRLVEPQAFLKVSALGVEEQRVNVIADFVDPPEARSRLGDAYRVEAKIVVWKGADVIKVNAGALFRYAGGWAVYRILDGRAVLTKVEVGRTNGLETKIVGGLKAGDDVIAYPSDRIRDGVRVQARAAER